MKPSERDEVLIRIDQKVRDSLPKIESHLEKINGHLEDHSRRLTIIETQRKLSKKALTGYVSGVVAIVVALWRAFNN